MIHPCIFLKRFFLNYSLLLAYIIFINCLHQLKLSTLVNTFNFRQNKMLLGFVLLIWNEQLCCHFDPYNKPSDGYS